MDRRHFLQAAVGTGFAASVLPVSAQTVIQTSAEGLWVSQASIAASGSGVIPAYCARPSSGKHWPVILVVSEIFGVHEHIQDVCRRLAHQGYMAIAPDLLIRQGNALSYTDIPTLVKEVISKVPDAQVMADLDATLEWAMAHGGDGTKLGVTGFCWGGRITWLYAAHQRRVRAGVAWYGRLTGAVNELQPKHPVDVVAQLHAPVLGLYGGADTGIPMDSVEAMQKALAQGSAQAQRAQWVVYPDTPHAFHADYRPSYRPEAARDAWAKSLQWWAQQGLSPQRSA